MSDKNKKCAPYMAKVAPITRRSLDLLCPFFLT